MEIINIKVIDRLIRIYKGITCSIYIPLKPHIAPDDGGHLMVVPNRIIDERSKLNPIELFEVNFLSIIAGKILKTLLGVDWINYQENGNWMLNAGDDHVLHLHIYGRKLTSKSQIFGEALKFPLKKDLHKLKIKAFSKAQIDSAIHIALEIVKEDWTNKYFTAFKKIK